MLQLEGLMKLRSVVHELSTDREFGYKFETTEDFWDKGIENLEVLQQVGYGLADFYISWLRIEKNLNRLYADETMLNLIF